MYPETILLNPVLEKTSSSCAEAGLSVIPIKAECQKAVTMLSSPTLFADIVKTDERAYLPYCSNYLNMFYFETQGVIENRGFYTCNSQSTRRCICNRGVMPPKSFPWPFSARYTHAPLMPVT